MVMIATKAGFSAALGAFVMGSLLAETVEAGKIAHIVQPVKDLFASIFFVSVGMMIDPAMMWEYAVPILTLTLLVLSGQVLFGSFGILLSGQPLKIAIQSGFSLTQVGEFAFIIASLGVSLNVTDKYQTASRFCCVPEAYVTRPFATVGPSWSTPSAFGAIISPQISPTISNTFS